MEQELRFGLDLGQLALLGEKKIWADYEQLFRLVFSSFHGQKKIKNIVASAQKLHKMKLFFFLKNFQKFYRL
jgi:hypothetical protein